MIRHLSRTLYDWETLGTNITVSEVSNRVEMFSLRKENICGDN